jgi:hypothetical protein
MDPVKLTQRKDIAMKKILLAGIGLVTLAGCQSTDQILDASQPMALDTALKRGQFEMGCPTATGTVLSRQVIEPVIRGPRYGGTERYEYTIGIEGCGKRETQVVICPEGGGGCFAAQSRR